MTSREQSIVSDYELGMGINRLASKYSIGQSSVYKVLNSNNVKIRKKGGHKKVFSQSELKELIHLYKEENWILKDLEKKFKTSKENIKETLESNGITLRKKYNLTYYKSGTKFNSYTYLHELKDRKNSKIYWKVVCDCGTTRELSKWDVVSGKSRHCGCKIKKGDRIIIKDREAYMSQLIFKEYQSSARKRKLSFNLTLDEFKRLSKSDCHYCGAFFPSIRVDEVTGYEYEYIGIDRKQNREGYEKDNVAPCCFNCNRMKSTMDYEEFLDIIKSIYTNNFS